MRNSTYLINGQTNIDRAVTSFDIGGRFEIGVNIALGKIKLKPGFYTQFGGDEDKGLSFLTGGNLAVGFIL